ncbi:Lrp/AsnC family transcriptional regulator [Noviherbaspirillum saxi]|uniref:Lrp/AsnC family transcriptional regulator n=1 Tax=Noviherbaspirillum saxi TaxID=2320863 RepID=A0A3A3FKZ8_9BURK|nr:Lrp/AsnC family transcriptional regulator [Noviherbaspirillum saxi]RJF92025.1 Lrp/AsnC family transcriptional regulator [Noviherbaspirillum saxi]
MTTINVDRYDLEILDELQQDGRTTNGTLGEKIHLSTSQVSRRIQRLEEAKVISHYAAMLDPDIVGLSVMAFTSVTLERHGEARSDTFERAVSDMPEVLECLSVTGEADYILRIVVPDLASFSAFLMSSLLRAPGVVNVKSNITLKRIKQTNVLPLGHLLQPTEATRKLVLAR